jgi:hypothetical protein
MPNCIDFLRFISLSCLDITQFYFFPQQTFPPSLSFFFFLAILVIFLFSYQMFMCDASMLLKVTEKNWNQYKQIIFTQINNLSFIYAIVHLKFVTI